MIKFATEKQVNYILFLEGKEGYYEREQEAFYLRKMTSKEASEMIESLIERKNKEKELEEKIEQAKKDVIEFESDEERLAVIEMLKENDLEDLCDILDEDKELAKKLYNINIFKNELDKKISDTFYNEYEKRFRRICSKFYLLIRRNKHENKRMVN